DHVALRQRQRAGPTACHRQELFEPLVREALVSYGPDYLRCLVGGRVVHDQDFERLVRLRQCAANSRSYEVGAVVNGNRDGDARVAWLSLPPHVSLCSSSESTLRFGHSPSPYPHASNGLFTTFSPW